MIFHLHKKIMQTDQIEVFKHVGSFAGLGSYGRQMLDRVNPTKYKIYTGEVFDIRVVSKPGVKVKVD